MINTNLQNRQLDREQSMFNMGRERYNNRSNNQQPSNRNIEHKLATTAIEDVAIEISRVIKEEEHRLGNRPTSIKSEWYDELKQVNSDVLSYLGLNVCFDFAGRQLTLTQVLASIGERIELEVWSLGLKSFDAKVSKLVEKQASEGHSSLHYRRRNALRSASKFGYIREKWTKKKRVKCGSVIVNAVLSSCDLFEILELKSIKNTRKYLKITDAAALSISEGHFDAAFADPMYSTMVSPPRPWVSITTGCYLDPVLSETVPLVRGSTPEQKKAIQHDFDTCEEGMLPKYVEALNIIQATPLKVNKTVFEAVQWCWEEKKIFGKFPANQYIDTPQRLSTEEYNKVSADGLQKLRRAGRERFQNKLDVDANITIMSMVLKLGREMLDYEKFYLPWNLDFRGRMYPVSIYSYHRDDHIKAQFQLFNGKPLGEHGAAWLMIHLANVGDFDKISKKPLQSRVNWVLENEEMLLAVGRDPKGTFDTWSKADKPFQFLAACEAFVGYIEEGDDYVCHLAPSLDGTNSGTQHYAAMLRSEDGSMVNLTKSDEVQDIYKMVADAVNLRLQKETSPLKEKWLDYKVSRGVTKRNCMTYSYSSTPIGMANQLQEDLMDKLNRDKLYGLIKDHPFGDHDSQRQHASYLAKINYEEIGNLIKSVKDGMEFLQAAAHALAKENKSIRWRSPSGFPAVQRYTTWNKTKVRIYLYDREAKIIKRSQITVRDPEPRKIDPRKAKSSIAANFVHSMDAAHMVSTILNCHYQGISDFMVIHDSFATTADNTIDLFQVVRQSFVDQYTTGCVLEQLLEDVRQRLNNPINSLLLEVPLKGNLDLSEVLESDYCFS